MKTFYYEFRTPDGEIVSGHHEARADYLAEVQLKQRFLKDKLVTLRDVTPAPAEAPAAPAPSPEPAGVPAVAPVQAQPTAQAPAAPPVEPVAAAAPAEPAAVPSPAPAPQPAAAVQSLAPAPQPAAAGRAAPAEKPAPVASSTEQGTPNRELMRKARECLSGHWGLAIGATVIVCVLSTIAKCTVVGIIIIGGPLMLGLAILFLALARRQDARVSQVFAGFQNFVTALLAYLLIILFVWLWSLLLVIPGIIAALAYSMSFFIIADNPGVGPLEAIRRSK